MCSRWSELVCDLCSCLFAPRATAEVSKQSLSGQVEKEISPNHKDTVHASPSVDIHEALPRYNLI